MTTLTEGSVASGHALSFRWRHRKTQLVSFFLSKQSQMLVLYWYLLFLTAGGKSHGDLKFVNFNESVELYREGDGIFVVKSQPALPSFFPSVEAMMGAWEFSWSGGARKEDDSPGRSCQTSLCTFLIFFLFPLFFSFLYSLYTFKVEPVTFFPQMCSGQSVDDNAESLEDFGSKKEAELAVLAALAG